jgi:hypothetical protein
MKEKLEEQILKKLSAIRLRGDKSLAEQNELDNHANLEEEIIIITERDRNKDKEKP